jgi:hypothetical protein
MIRRFRQDIRNLVEASEGIKVSIYLPTHRASVQTGQDRLQLKNLIRDAEHQLQASGVSQGDSRALLSGSERLLADEHAWLTAEEGLAVFASRGFQSSYSIPVDVPAVAVVNERFYVKPLLPLLEADAVYFVLAISPNAVRLFRATRFSIEERPVDGIPKSLAELLAVEQYAPQIQARSSSGSRSGAAVFHGHGDEEQTRKQELLEFFQRVDHGVRRELREESVPLVVAAVESNFSLYREANSYPHLFERCAHGNPDRLSPAEILRSAWPVVAPHFDKSKVAAWERINAGRSAGRASFELPEIVPVAFAGRVDVAFVSAGIQAWGRFSTHSGRAEVFSERLPDSEDLLDLVAAHTFLNGGSPYAVPPEEMPGGALAAAAFRY